MPGRFCVIPSCSSSDYALSKVKSSICDIHKSIRKECNCEMPYKLRAFPPKDEKFNLWREAIKDVVSSDYFPKSGHRICSKHFAKPHDEFPTIDIMSGSARSPTKKKGRIENTKKTVLLNITNDDNNSPSITTVNQSKGKRKFETCELNEATQTENPEKSNTETQTPVSSTFAAETQTILTEKVAMETQTVLSVCDASTQWEDDNIDDTGNIYFDTLDHSYSKASVSSTEISIQVNLPDVNYVTLDNKDSKFYTGLNACEFLKLVQMLKVFHVRGSNLSAGDCILMVLMRLRLGLLFADLGRRFRVSTSKANRIVNTWLQIMVKELRDLVSWLPREMIQASMPKKFKENYPKTTCVIDCAEIFVQRPKQLRARALTYSNYKHHNTMKFLISIAPCGYIMFISKCYGGRASDKHIVNASGFLDFLLPGDEVMADRGFTIEMELALKCARLNIPAFTKQRKQLPESEVIRTRRIATVRIHVERAIARLRNYRILKNTFSVKNANQNGDIYINVCAMLCNLQGLLINDS